MSYQSSSSSPSPLLSSSLLVIVIVSVFVVVVVVVYVVAFSSAVTAVVIFVVSIAVILPLPSPSPPPLLSQSCYGASLGGALCYINNPTLRLFSHTCLHISHTHRRPDETAQKAQTTDKHHHHGGAARPSSGMDLMNPCPCRLRGGRPCACSFLCCRRSDSIDSIYSSRI